MLELRLTHDEYVNSDEYDRRIDLPEEVTESSHRFTLQPAGVVEGTLVDAEDELPINGGRVTVSDSDGANPHSDWTMFDGAFRIVGLPPGRRVLTVHAAGFAPVEGGVEFRGIHPEGQVVHAGARFLDLPGIPLVVVMKDHQNPIADVEDRLLAAVVQDLAAREFQSQHVPVEFHRPVQIRRGQGHVIVEDPHCSSPFHSPGNRVSCGTLDGGRLILWPGVD